MHKVIQVNRKAWLKEYLVKVHKVIQFNKKAWLKEYLVKVHKVIQFNKKAWLKEYIDMNTKTAADVRRNNLML